MKKNILIVGLLLLVIYLVAPKGDAAFPGQQLSDVSTSTFRVVGTSSTLLLAANANRNVAKLCNNGSNTFYVGYGSAAVSSSGAFVTSNGCEQFDPDDRFIGAVYAATKSGTTSITIVEY